MKRRNFIQNLSLTTAAITTAGISKAAETKAFRKTSPVLTVAHITDVHIRPDEDVPARYKKCLEEVKKHKPDFILNGGDSIHDASYDNVKRERVTELWDLWDDCCKPIQQFEMYSCIGNHDIWWAAPSKEDEMYGVNYVTKRLKIPDRYYSFSKKGWHFVVLDGNNKGITLDEEQYQWLENDLNNLAVNTPVLLMSHYPILTVTGSWEGGQHGDHKQLKQLFYKHKDKVKVCLSGHQHLLDRAWYNDVHYFCNGAMSGFWWGKGDTKSAAPYYYQETAPGYAILKLYADGSVENEYIEHKL